MPNHINKKCRFCMPLSCETWKIIHHNTYYYVVGKNSTYCYGRFLHRSDAIKFSAKHKNVWKILATR